MSQNTYILATGSYLPEKILSNNDISKFLDTSDEWIQQRTGIKQRHIAESNQQVSDLAAEAAVKAIFKADISPEEIDLIICATSTPDLTFPCTAALIQKKLDIKDAIAFDVGQAACNGFVTALHIADSVMKNSSHIRKALVIGAETFSRLLDWSDRSTCVLFGDGAGCVILDRTNDSSQGILATHLYNDASLTDILYSNGGIGQTADPGQVVMNGKAVFKEAVQKLAQAAADLLKAENISQEDLDWLVPHQANARIIKSTADHLSLPMEKVIMTVDQHANTSAASIPIALDAATQEGKFKHGDLLLLDALGAGISWGASLIRWVSQ